MIKKRRLHISNMQMEIENMQNRKPMVLVLAGPNGSGKRILHLKQYCHQTIRWKY